MEFIKQFNKCEIYSPTQQHHHDHVNAIGKQSLLERSQVKGG